ncbi:protein FAM207A [Thalassophryne amazonica]|uniref:protein FAM207A n=1 Tax=Thalassophryne amazonica TaxID=390379 RepID=UPI001470ECE7|nr:protein FAM207A [Thalassophryne amazonica]
MVGKVKRVRHKLHQEAVKVDRLNPAALGSVLAPDRPLWEIKKQEEKNSDVSKSQHEDCFQTLRSNSQEPKSLPDGIFAGTKITPEVLVQSLMIEGPVDVPKPAKTGAEVKKIRSKKEKMKERRERWLNKISSIKKAKEQKAAEEQRKATPVVGDMRVLADALPELSQLIAPTTSIAHRKNRKTKVPVKRKEPTDYSQMKQSQKRKLLETEMIRFGDAVKSLTSKSNPLSDIGEQLKKRMRQEEEPVPS